MYDGSGENRDDIQVCEDRKRPEQRREGTESRMVNAPTNTSGRSMLPLPEGKLVGPRLMPLDGVP